MHLLILGKGHMDAATTAGYVVVLLDKKWQGGVISWVWERIIVHILKKIKNKNA